MTSESHTFFFDFSAVLDRCEALRRNPERIVLMCQNQVRSLAPDELMIPRDKGFLLVVRTRFGDAAEALASEINAALHRRLFGSDHRPDTPPMFRPVRHGEVLEFGLVSHSRRTLLTARSRRPVKPSQQPAPPAPPEWTDFKPGLLPIFNLQQEAPPIYLSGPVSIRDGKYLFGGEALKFCHPQYRPSLDIAMLEFALNLLPYGTPAKQVSAVATSVSYETLAWLRSRRSYLDALRAAQIADNPHVIVKIDDVPRGTPVWRMTELVAMLKPVVKRIFVQLSDRDNSLARSSCIGAAGFCAAIGPQAELSEIANTASRLRNIATAQHAFSYVMGVDSAAALNVIRDAGIRLASKRPDPDGIYLGGLRDGAAPMHRDHAA